MKQKIQFIINPFSGTSNKANMPELINQYLDLDQFEYTIAYTERPRHAIVLAKKAIEDQYDIVCAVGGDGSVNEVASALVGSSTALAIIPAGSGNGFAGHISLGRDPILALKSLNSAQTTIIDTCAANEQFFLNVAGIGFDALVAYKTKRNKKRGLLPYLWTALKESYAFKPMHLSITVDDQLIEGDYVAAVVANASYYGYGFSISPLSSVQDGLMDLILIKKSLKIRYFVEAYRFLNKTLHESRVVETYKGKDIRIKAFDKYHFHVDGEGYELDGTLKCQITPLSLKILSPMSQL